MKIQSQNKQALETALLNAYNNELEIKIVAMPVNEDYDVLDNLIKTTEIEIAKRSECYTTPKKLTKQLIDSVLAQNGTEDIYEIDLSIRIDNEDSEAFLTVEV